MSREISKPTTNQWREVLVRHNSKEPIMADSLGDKVVGRLKTFTKALKQGNAERFTCRKVVLNLKPEPYSPELIQETRLSLRVSQSLFAKFLGVTVKTVCAWEQGINTPNDMACRFMDEIRRNPSYWQARLKESMQTKPPKTLS